MNCVARDCHHLSEDDDVHPVFFKLPEAQAAAHNCEIPPALAGQTEKAEHARRYQASMHGGATSK
ncbi:MAG: hypothetical protein ABSD70_07695 [Terracidiphilus sp.]